MKWFIFWGSVKKLRSPLLKLSILDNLHPESLLFTLSPVLTCSWMLLMLGKNTWLFCCGKGLYCVRKTKCKSKQGLYCYSTAISLQAGDAGFCISNNCTVFNGLIPYLRCLSKKYVLSLSHLVVPFQQDKSVCKAYKGLNKCYS